MKLVTFLAVAIFSGPIVASANPVKLKFGQNTGALLDALPHCYEEFQKASEETDRVKDVDGWMDRRTTQFEIYFEDGGGLNQEPVVSQTLVIRQVRTDDKPQYECQRTKH